MTDIKADTDILEVTDLHDFQQVFRLGDFVLDIFEQQVYAQRLAEDAHVFDRGDGVVQCARTPLIFALAQMQHEELERQGLCDFESALPFIHGVDTPRLVRMDDIHGSPPPRPPSSSAQMGACMEWIATGFEANQSAIPYMGAAGVVEMLPGSKDFNGLRARFVERFKQAGVQACLRNTCVEIALSIVCRFLVLFGLTLYLLTA